MHDDDIPPPEAAEFSRAFDLYVRLDEVKAQADAARLRLMDADRRTSALECEARERLVEATDAKVANIEAELEALKALHQGHDLPTDSAGAPEVAPKSGDYDAELAALFDPVKVATLKAMFPDEKWGRYADKAPRNGLKVARVGHGIFNPYLAARWWLHKQAPDGWRWERCVRTLANNLPARSRDSKHLLTGDFD